MAGCAGLPHGKFYRLGFSSCALPGVSLPSSWKMGQMVKQVVGQVVQGVCLVATDWYQKQAVHGLKS